MNVYVESNFVIEIALEQEQAAACQELLDLATAAKIAIALPAYALLEPVETVTRRVAAWRQVGRESESHLKQLRRNPQLAAEAPALHGLTIRAADLATRGLRDAQLRLLEDARVLPLNADTIRDADRYAQQFGISLPDAVMFAAVMRGLDGRGDAVFLNRNSHDFAGDLKDLLRDRRCELKTSFDAGLQFVQSKLRSSETEGS